MCWCGCMQRAMHNRPNEDDEEEANQHSERINGLHILAFKHTHAHSTHITHQIDYNECGFRISFCGKTEFRRRNCSFNNNNMNWGENHIKFIDCFLSTFPFLRVCVCTHLWFYSSIVIKNNWQENRAQQHRTNGTTTNEYQIETKRNEKEKKGEGGGGKKQQLSKKRIKFTSKTGMNCWFIPHNWIWWRFTLWSLVGVMCVWRARVRFFCTFFPISDQNLCERHRLIKTEIVEESMLMWIDSMQSIKRAHEWREILFIFEY